MDRNKFISNVCPPVGRSLSARRAWIEIISVRGHGFWPRVALRKESVDRNLAGGHFIDLGQKSLSARRAWIEIVITAMTSQISVSRSPQGERG